jgi:hypothetical protein
MQQRCVQVESKRRSCAEFSTIMALAQTFGLRS